MQPLSMTLMAAVVLLPWLPSGQARGPESALPKVGTEAPELQVAEDAWLNWSGEISLEKLRGHVVWLEFSFLA